MSVFEKLNWVEKDNEVKQSTVHDENTYPQEEFDSDIVLQNKHEEKEEEVPEVDKEYMQHSEKPGIKQQRKATIQEIYTAYDIENSDINTVFMLGNFINALPDSLPYEVRKKTLISILNSSNTDLMKLMDDGKERMSALNQFSKDYYVSTINTIEEYKGKIAELKSQISNYEEQIRSDEALLREQNNLIRYEMDRIESIINFINNGD